MSNRHQDEYAGKKPLLLPVEKLRQLSEINSLRSTSAIIFDWLIIAASITLCQFYWHPLLYIAAVFVIGGRIHGLLVLMHNGAHYRILQNRKWNDIISELFLAWPMLITMQAYRATHFPHHQYTNTAKDPDLMMKQNSEWEFPKSAKGIAVILIKELFALNTFKKIKEMIDLAQAPKTQTSDQKGVGFYKFGRIAFYLAAAALITYFQAWPEFLMYWIVPVFTAAVFVLRVRSIAEHFGIEHETVFSESRTVYPSFIDRIFFAPHHVNYHLDHHLYPSVPFYRLPELHRALMQVPEYSEQAHITHTYWNVLRECMNCKGNFVKDKIQTPKTNFVLETVKTTHS